LKSANDSTPHDLIATLELQIIVGRAALWCERAASYSSMLLFSKEIRVFELSDSSQERSFPAWLPSRIQKIVMTQTSMGRLIKTRQSRSRAARDSKDRFSEGL